MEENMETEALNEERIDDNESGGEENQTQNPADASQRVEPVKRRIIKNPQPRLNPERLCGPRGIEELLRNHEKVTFKGKNHEKEDLNNLMGLLEHWAHRLYPKLPFDATLEQIENLGNKRMTKVYVSKIRLGMPVRDEDFISEEQINENNLEDNISSQPPTLSGTRDDIFDELLRTQIELEEEMQSQPTTSFSTQSNTSDVLTEDQKQMIRQKRLLAAEKQKLKFQQSLLEKSNQETLAVSQKSNDIHFGDSEDEENDILKNILMDFDETATDNSKAGKNVNRHEDDSSDEDGLVIDLDGHSNVEGEGITSLEIHNEVAEEKENQKDIRMKEAASPIKKKILEETNENELLNVDDMLDLLDD